MKITIVSDLSKIDEHKWSNFVYNHPNGNFFQSPQAFQFFQSVENYNPLLIIAKENNEIKGSLLAVVIKDGSGIKSYLSRRCIVWGGPLCYEERTAELLIIELSEKVKRDAIYTEFRNLFDTTNLKDLFYCQKFFYYEWYNFILDLKNTDDPRKCLNKTKRWEINKSLKTGAQILEATSLGEIKSLYNILSELYRLIIKKPLPSITFFEKLFELAIAKIFLVKYNNKVIGGTICPIYNDKIYEWYECSINTIKDVYVSSLATYAPIEYGFNNNLNYLDFMGAGSPNEDYGVREFKSKFGGKLVSYGRYIRINKPIFYWVGKTGLKILQKLK